MSQFSFTTPVILALTRRAMICGLPYSAFISLLIGGCVAFIWIDSINIVMGLLLASYLYCSFLCHQDSWALDIFFQRLQQLRICPFAVKQYFKLRSYSPE